MAPWIKRVLKRTLLVAHILICVLLLLSAFLPRLHPQQYRVSGMAGMPFLFLLLVALAFIPVWLLYRKKYYLISVAVLLLCLQSLSVSFGYNVFGRNSATTAGNGFRVMTFNTSSFGLDHWVEDSSVQNNAYRMLQQARPDILCLQEFYTGTDTFRTNHIDSLKSTLHLDYHFFTDDHEYWNKVALGIALYSRYPIIQARRIEVDTIAVGSGRSILEADLLVNKDTLRVYAVQLKSYMFNANDFNDIYRIKHLRDYSLDGTHHILSKMLHTFSTRACEADTLHALATQSPYPVLICGDFNDVPVSYTYNVLSNGMRDAFLEQGWGIGRTYRSLSPTLRIDYILSDPRLHCEAYETFPHPKFEHTPVMATLHLQKL